MSNHPPAAFIAREPKSSSSIINNNFNNNSNSNNNNGNGNGAVKDKGEVQLDALASAAAFSLDDPFQAYILKFPLPPPWRQEVTWVDNHTMGDQPASPSALASVRRTSSFNLNHGKLRDRTERIEFVNDETGERSASHPLLRLRQLAGLETATTATGSPTAAVNNNSSNNSYNRPDSSRSGSSRGRRDIISMLKLSNNGHLGKHSSSSTSSGLRVVAPSDAAFNSFLDADFDEQKDSNYSVDNNNNNNNSNNINNNDNDGNNNDNTIDIKNANNTTTNNTTIDGPVNLVRAGSGKSGLPYTDFYCSWKEIQAVKGQTGYSMRLRHFVDNSFEVSFSGLDGCWQLPFLEGPYGSVTKYDLYIGSKVTVFGRHLTITSTNATTCRRIDDTAAMLIKKAEWCRVQVEKVGSVPCIRRPEIMGAHAKSKATGTYNLRKLVQDISKLGEQLSFLGMGHVFLDATSGIEGMKSSALWRDVPVKGIDESIYHG